MTVQIRESVLFDHPRRGLFSLGIPDLDLDVLGPWLELVSVGAIDPVLSVDEAHLVRVTKDSVPVGLKDTRKGYLAFSREGYEFYKDRIKKNFKPKDHEQTWEQFEASAEVHFTLLEDNLKKKLARDEKRRLKASKEEREKC